MDDLTSFLIISGMVIIFLIGLVTYLKNNKKEKGSANNFSQQKDSIDDVLLSSSPDSFSGRENLNNNDLPQSFATKESDQWVENTRLVNVVKPSNSSTSSPNQKISISHMALPEGISDYVIAMSIQRDNHAFSGEEILTACRDNNLIHGEMNIFHYPAEEKSSTYALFSMANMVEPGTFDLNKMDNFTTPGISLFIQLPLPMNCIQAYNKFVEQAKSLSKSLNADLYDEKFNILTPQIISHTLESISSFQRELMKAEKKKA